ncbi:MAG: class A beta-lactamase-related serine hydrolase [Halomonadaceae bacterium]|nr:MAG: class A beta-lactamase-related serine hydrolase [Halomonadaceae bacterium]
MSLLSLNRRFHTETDLTLPKRLSTLSDRGPEVRPHRGGLEQANIERVWRSMKGFYATGMNPGLALTLRRQGELVFDRTLGYANLETRIPLAVDTPVCLFSASKVVTAMLIHHLAEQGLLDLEQRVSHYLPAYGCNGKEQTKINHLLTHRAGIPRIRETVSPEAMFNPDQLTELLTRAEPDKPGRRQAYHALTAGFILGALIEKVTGESINAVLDRVIRKPMGMTYFRFGIEGAEPALNYATGIKNRAVDAFLTYAVGGPLDEAVRVSNDPRFRQVSIPAGNMYATGEEATRFFQMLLNGGEWQGKQIFHPDTVKNAVAPAGPGRLDRTLMIPMRYSKGFMLGARVLSLYGLATEQAFGHLGFISIYCWADPQRQLSGALLTTGKGILGPHVPALLRLQHVINREMRGAGGH